MSIQNLKSPSSLSRLCFFPECFHSAIVQGRGITWMQRLHLKDSPNKSFGTVSIWMGLSISTRLVSFTEVKCVYMKELFVQKVERWPWKQLDSVRQRVMQSLRSTPFVYVDHTDEHPCSKCCMKSTSGRSPIIKILFPISALSLSLIPWYQ